MDRLSFTTYQARRMTASCGEVIPLCGVVIAVITINNIFHLLIVPMEIELFCWWTIQYQAGGVFMGVTRIPGLSGIGHCPNVRSACIK